MAAQPRNAQRSKPDQHYFTWEDFFYNNAEEEPEEMTAEQVYAEMLRIMPPPDLIA